MVMENLKILEIMRKRRSVREFTEQPVEDRELEIMLESARIAPSSTNSQPWRFIVVRDKSVIAEISHAIPLGIAINRFLKKAPCIIVCCGERTSISHLPAKNIYPVDLLTIDVSIAIEHIVLTATELGIGTCWIGWYSEKKLKKILDIPKMWKVISLLAVGYPKEPLELHEHKRKELSKIAFVENLKRNWTDR